MRRAIFLLVLLALVWSPAQAQKWSGWKGTGGTSNAADSSLGIRVSTTLYASTISERHTNGLGLQVSKIYTTGGNAVGAGAVDFQITRGVATQVASGNYSFLGGGANNTVNAEYSGHAAGYNTTVSGSFSYGAANYSGTLAGGYSFMAATRVATIDAAVACGVVIGSYSAQARLNGQHVQAWGQFASQGDSQGSTLILRVQTTDATVTDMRLNGGPVFASTDLTLENNVTYVFKIFVVARGVSGTNDDAGAGYEFSLVCDNNAGTSALIGSVTKTVLGEDIAGWDCNVTIDDASDRIDVEVTGDATTTINWVARVLMVEVGG